MKKNERAFTQRKKGKLPKEFVPQSKNPIREMIPFKIPNEYNRIFKNEIEPVELFPEWPGDDVARNFDFSQVDNNKDNSYLKSLDNLFSDPKNDEIHLPDSILYHCSGNIKWIRPDKWVKDFMVDKEIRKSFPKKNPIKFRSVVKEMYREIRHSSNDDNNFTNSNSNINLSPRKSTQNDFLGSNEMSSEEMKFKNEYGDLIGIYQKPLENKVVYFSVKQIDNPDPIKPEPIPKTRINQDRNASQMTENTNQAAFKEIRTMNPGDLVFDEKLPYFCKWISSLIQTIKDLDILKIDSIIYPQKDGIPVYNPVGRYWLKLFHMGKYRKIEIDDRIPCSKFEEFMFPHCENVEEIWPALITKGILKLFSYRFRKLNYNKENILEEKSDISILYSLTGFIPEHLNINYMQEDKFENLANLLSDDRYLNKQKYFFCYNNYALESTSKKLDYKFNYKNKYGEAIDGIPLNKINSIMDQPFMGINIFKNYFGKMKKNNSSFDCNQAVFSDGSPEKNYENVLENDLENSNKKKAASLKISMGDAKRLAKLRAKKNSSGIFNEDGNYRIPINIEIEKIMNKLNPTCFKDDVLILQKDKNELYKSIKQSLMLKEKTNKISTNILQKINYFVESKLAPMEEKHIVNQILNINNIIEKGQKIKNSNNDMLHLKKTKNVFSDILYSVSDVFYSGEEFNMKRLQPVDFTDLKQKILAAQTNFKLLSAHEKKNYIQNIKELKMKNKEDKKNRLMELNKPGEKVYLVKIQHGLKKIISNLLEDYSNEEVIMAKKCVLNNWKFPPASYFENSFSKYDFESAGSKKGEDKNKEPSDDQKYPNSIKMMNTSWTKDFYIKMVKNINDDNLNISQMNDKKIQQSELDFYKNPKEVIEREKKGIWINWNTFLNIFKGFLILHNPKNYTSIVNIDSNWYNFKSDIYASEKYTLFFTSNLNNIDKSYLSNTTNPNETKEIKENNPFDKKKEVKGNQNVTQNQTLGNNSNKNILNLYLNNFNGTNCSINQRMNLENNFDNNNLPNTKFLNNLNNSCINIIFEPNSANSLLFNDMKFYIIFDLISFSGRKLFSNIRLTGHFSSFQFDEIIFEQDYYLVITGGLHPFGYNLRIMSDHFIETLTYFNYMKRLNNLSSVSLNVSHPVLEKNRIFLLAKIKIETKEDSNFIFNLKQNEGSIDNNLKQYYEFFLIKKNSENKINMNKLYEITKSDEPYIINVNIIPPYNLNEGSFELEFLTSNPEMKIELIEMIEPYEISDKFTPNKHGIIMKEQVHIPENLSCSLDIEFKKKARAKSPKSLSSGGSGNKSQDPEFLKIEKSIRLILEITKDDNIIYSTHFFTKTFISHLELNFNKNFYTNSNSPVVTEINQKDKKAKETNQSKAPFNMIIKLDMSEAPKELLFDSEDKDNDYFWFIRFFSTESIALMKDTSKEERESALKEGWEQKNTGRAEKAKLSRKKFLLIGKKNRGEPLTAEEETLLNEMRNKVYLTNLEDGRKKDDPKNKDKKDIQRDGKSAKSKESKDKPKLNPLNDPNLGSKQQFLKQSFYQRSTRTRLLPRPENHSAHYLKNFLSYAYRDRVMKSEHKISKFCLDEEKVKGIKFNIENRYQKFNNRKSTEEDMFNERKKKMAEEVKGIKEQNMNRRRFFSGRISELMNSRVQIIDQIDKHYEIEKKLKDAAAGDYELEKTISIYKETISDNTLYMKFKDLCNDIFNYISEKKEENYKTEIKKYNLKDKTGIIKALEDFNANNWNISDDIAKKLNDLSK